MKTAEELTALKEEVETLNRKLTELTEEELAQISGGGAIARVKGDDIARMNITEAAAALQGKVPGVNIIPSQGQPGSSDGTKLR